MIGSFCVLAVVLGTAYGQAGNAEVNNKVISSNADYLRAARQALVEVKPLLNAKENMTFGQEIDGIVLDERFEPRYNWKFRRVTFRDNQIKLRDMLDFLLHNPHRVMEFANETKTYNYLERLRDNRTRVFHATVHAMSGTQKLPPRDLVMVGTWDLDLKTGSFYGATVSVDHKDAPVTKEFIRVHTYPSGFKVTPLPDGSIEFVAVFNTDVKYPKNLSQDFIDIFARARTMEKMLEMRNYLRNYPH